jgi:hypothetical protein
MGLNKIGKNTRKAKSNILSEILGVRKTSGSQCMETPENAGVAESFYRHEQIKKTLQEIEVRRRQTATFVRRFQNR